MNHYKKCKMNLKLIDIIGNLDPNPDLDLDLIEDLIMIILIIIIIIVDNKARNSIIINLINFIQEQRLHLINHNKDIKIKFTKIH